MSHTSICSRGLFAHVILAVAAVWLTSGQTAKANLIANGNFESGNVGFSSGYTYSHGNIAPEGVFDVVTDPHNSHPGGESYGDHTSGSGLMLAVNGSSVAGALVWSETVGVTPGRTFDINGWLSNWSALPQVTTNLRLQVNGSILGEFTSPANFKVWAPFDYQWPSGANTSAHIEFISLSTAPVGNDFALDDLAMNEVPEPAGPCAIAVILTALMCRRRGSNGKRANLPMPHNSKISIPSPSHAPCK